MLCKLLLVSALFVLIQGRGEKPCPPLPPVQNGKYEVVSSTKMKVVCNPPYIYKKRSKILSCKYGKWSDPSPRCETRRPSCEPPETIENGRIVGLPPYTIGSTVKYYCDDGFGRTGDFIRRCQSILTWTGNAPACSDTSINGVANRISDQFDRIEVTSGGGSNFTNLGRAIGMDVEFKGLDLFLIFDKSSSIRPSQFEKGIEFAKFLIQRFNISNGPKTKEGGTRLSVITFGNNQKEEITLDDVTISSTKIAQQKLDQIKCGEICDGSTNMAAAFSRVEVKLNDVREEAKKALFITSDGVPDQVKPPEMSAEALANVLKEKEVEIFAIGIGQDIDRELLRNLANEPPVDHVFLLNEFDNFNDVIRIIREKSPPRPPPELDECGYVTELGAKQRNNNTGAVKAGAWPWLAAIITANHTGGQHSRFACSGALVSSNLVLTTASCVIGKEPNDVYIILGEDDLRVNSNNEQYFYAEDIIIYDDYDDVNRPQNDIALVKLNSNAIYGDYVRPACIAENELRSTSPETKVMMVGWLITSEESTRLQQYPLKSFQSSQTVLKLLSINDCERNSRFSSVCKIELMGSARVGGRFSRNCFGDEGSLLMVEDDDRTYIVGLVSSADGCNLRNKLATFNRLSYFNDWINMN